MNRVFLVGVLIAALIGVSPAWTRPLRFDREKVLAFDMRVERFSPRRSPATGGPGVVWSVNLPPLPRAVPKIRLCFKVIAAGDPSTWEIRVKELGGVATLQTIPGAAIVATPGVYWTDELPAPTAKVELAWSGGGERPVVESDRYAFATGVATPQSVVKGDQRVEIAREATFRAAGRSIARLRFMTDEGQAYCTGFLLGEGLL